MQTLKNKINKILRINNKDNYKTKYNFYFNEDQINRNTIINQYKKNFTTKDYSIDVMLLSVKYPKDELILFDQFENFLILIIDEYESGNKYIVGDLLSYKNKNKDDIQNDYDKKVRFLTFNNLETILDEILKNSLKK